MNKQAFTLLELIMVMSIICVLSAIAWPQYQVAVNKSRYAKLMPMAKAIKQAEESFYADSSSYTQDFTNLTVKAPGSVRGGSNGSIVDVGDGTVVELFSNGTQDYVKVSRDNFPNAFVMYFDKSANFPGGIHCEAVNTGADAARARKLCLSYGPSNPDSPITGTDGNYDAYILNGPTEGIGSGAGGGGGESGCGSSGCYGDTQIPNGVFAWFEDYDENGVGVIIGSLEDGWYGVHADGDGMHYNPELNVVALDDYAYFFGNDGTEIGRAQCNGVSARNCSSWGECDGECPTLDQL